VLGFGILAGVYLGIRLRRDEHGGYLFFYRSPYRQFFSLVIIASVFVASAPEMAYAGTPVYDDPIFYYFHSDHLGSSNIMTDADGDLVQQYGYMPFGDERYENNTQAFSVTNRYTGQQLDEETGLYFYGSRYYDPELARFIRPDSIGQGASSQSLNRYTYCINNPLKFTDPTGHFIDPVTWIIIGAIVGAGVGGGIAAAQGGNFWMGALAGGIAGAFGGYGWAVYGSAGNIVGAAACAAAGGALGALVTGGDPGMAAATAAITATISFGLFSEGGVFGSFSGTPTEQAIKQLAASTGVGALVGGITAEIFGGSFGEGALWGAAAAAASFALMKVFEEQINSDISRQTSEATFGYKPWFDSDKQVQRCDPFHQVGPGGNIYMRDPATGGIYDVGIGHILDRSQAPYLMVLLIGPLPNAKNWTLSQGNRIMATLHGIEGGLSALFGYGSQAIANSQIGQWAGGPYEVPLPPSGKPVVVDFQWIDAMGSSIDSAAGEWFRNHASENLEARKYYLGNARRIEKMDMVYENRYIIRTKYSR
jgi:RHS repeat-associated protein